MAKKKKQINEQPFIFVKLLPGACHYSYHLPSLTWEQCALLLAGLKTVEQKLLEYMGQISPASECFEGPDNEDADGEK